MLRIKIPLGPDGWDEANETFVEGPSIALDLEHSLVSISKWESKWHKAFLSDREKSAEETMDYIKCMVLDENVDHDVFNLLTQDNINKINEYIGNPMTATVIHQNNNRVNNQRKEVVTSELIYFWMIVHQIPSEYQHWHLNRLLTLIRVCDAKTSSPAKRSKGDIMRDHAAINKANRAKYQSKG